MVSTDRRPYLLSLPIQSLIPNVQILVYPLALSNLTCRELIIPPISVPFIGNVME
jgi:hypothetical protein